MRRLKDESMIPLLIGESLLDQQEVNSIIDNCIPPRMMANACSRKSSVHIRLHKQSVVVFSSCTLAIEEETIRLMQEFTELEDLAKSKIHKTEMLELALMNEKTAKANIDKI